MWSSVKENITDGTSGLLPSNTPVALVVGTSSHGPTNQAITIGKKSDLAEIVNSETGERLLGYGEMPRRIKNMQSTMNDVNILALKTKGDISGLVSEIDTKGTINIEVTGSPLFEAKIDIAVHGEGHPEGENTKASKTKKSENHGLATIKINISGDQEDEKVTLIPSDGVVILPDLGIKLIFPIDALYLEECAWSFSTTSPLSNTNTIIDAIKNALEIHTPEFIFVAQSVNADFVKQMGVLSEELFEDHKPTLILTETTLNPTLSISEAISEKQKEFKDIDARFVSVVCQPLANNVSASGLVAGHITKARVNQSVGATNFFAVYNQTLPDNWSNVHSRALDESRFITMRTYAGLQNHFWTNGRTMANDKSDYRYIEVVRTVFKAIRLARRASLPFIHADGDEVGLQNLLAEVRNSIDGMTAYTPKELDNYEVLLPEGQDIANNGVVLEISLFGIPVIRQITLNFMFKYNNSTAL